MNSILSKLEHSTAIPTEAQVESLALERHNNSGAILRVDNTYLRILLLASQAQLGRRSRAAFDAEAQATVLNTVHDRYYSAVLRGVTTHDIEIDETQDPKERTRRSLERNRRSAFARSAKSVLLSYVEGGGDMRKLDVTTVTKGMLRKAVTAPEPTNKVERQIARSKGALFRAIARQAKSDAYKAQQTLEAAIDELQLMLNELPDEDDAEPEPMVDRRAPPDRPHARTRVGVPLLNRGA